MASVLAASGLVARDPRFGQPCSTASATASLLASLRNPLGTPPCGAPDSPGEQPCPEDRWGQGQGRERGRRAGDTGGRGWDGCQGSEGGSDGAEQCGAGEGVAGRDVVAGKGGDSEEGRCGGGVTPCRPSRAPRPALSESRLRSLSRSALLAEVASAEMSLHAIYLHQVCPLPLPGSPCPQHRGTGPLGFPGVPRVSLSGCSASPPGSPAWPRSLVPCPLSPVPFEAVPTLPDPLGDTPPPFLAAASWG